MSDARPYTDEEMATAERATMDFFGPDTLATERDMAMFDAGFKCGRRTPKPATARVLKEAAAMLIDDDGSEITGGAYEFPCFTRRELRAFIAEHHRPS